MVAKPLPCCGHTSTDQGRIFLVAEIYVPPPDDHCRYCGSLMEPNLCAAASGEWLGYDLPLLIRINDPDLTETITEETEHETV